MASLKLTLQGCGLTMTLIHKLQCYLDQILSKKIKSHVAYFRCGGQYNLIQNYCAEFMLQPAVSHKAKLKVAAWVNMHFSIKLDPKVVQ